MMSIGERPKTFPETHAHGLDKGWVRVVSQERLKDIDFDRSGNLEEVWMGMDGIQGKRIFELIRRRPR